MRLRRSHSPFNIVRQFVAGTESILDLEAVRAAVTTLTEVEAPSVEILQAELAAANRKEVPNDQVLAAFSQNSVSN